MSAEGRSRRAGAVPAPDANAVARTPDDDAKRVVIYTDGACKGNPGPGGWGALLIFDGREKELFGGERQTTNNRMELTAVIRALEALTRACDVDLYLDSQYVKQGIESWIHKWKKNGWRTSDRKPVKMPNYGASSTRCVPGTGSAGIGCAAMRIHPAITAPMHSPIAASPR